MMSFKRIELLNIIQILTLLNNTKIYNEQF